MAIRRLATVAWWLLAAACALLLAVPGLTGAASGERIVGGPLAIWQSPHAAGSQVDLLDGGISIFLESSGPGEGRIQVEPTGVDCGPVCVTRVQAGDTVTLHANPAPGSAFAGWAGGCFGQSRTCKVTIDQPRMFNPIFVRGGVHLSTTRSGDGSGKIASDGPEIDCGDDCEDHYRPGDRVILTAEPDPQNAFVGWSGDCSGETMKCLVEIGEEPMEVEAEFAPSSRIPDWIRPSLGTPGGSYVTNLSLSAAGPDGIPTAFWQRREDSFSSIHVTQAEDGRIDAPSLRYPASFSSLFEVTDLLWMPDNPLVAEGPDGTTVWVGLLGTSERAVKVSARAPGGDFGPVETIATGTVSDPAVVVGPHGTFVTWRREVDGKYRLEMRHRPPGGEFGSLQVVSATGDDVSEPRLAIAPNGKVGFAWLASPALWFREWLPHTGGLGGLSLGDFGGVLKPALTYGSQSQPIVTYLQGDTSQTQVKALIKPPGSDSQTGFPTRVALSTAGQNTSPPRLATSPEGTVVATWRRNGQIEAAAKEADQATFGPTQLLPGVASAEPTPLSSFSEVPDDPVMAEGPDGTMVVAWMTGTSERTVQLSTRSPGGNFGPVESLSTGAVFDLALATGPSGTFVSWRRKVDGKYRLEMRHRPPGAPFGSPQLVSAPSDDVSASRMAMAPSGKVGFAWLDVEGAPMLMFREWFSQTGLGGFSVGFFGEPVKPAALAYGSQGEAILAYLRGAPHQSWVEAAIKPSGTDSQTGFPLRDVLSDVGQEISQPRLAAGPEGGIVATWRRSGHIEAAARWAGQASFGSTQLIAGKAAGDTSSIGSPTLAASSDDEFAVVWKSTVGTKTTIWSATSPSFGTFSPATVVTSGEPVSGDPQVAFDPGQNLRVAWVRPDQVPENIRMITRPPKVTRVLEIAREASTGGRVRSDPLGLDCGTRCSHDVYVGTRVVLTAEPSPGHVFLGWVGDRCGGWSGPCVLDMERDYRVRPIFAEGPRLTVSKRDVTSGESTGRGRVVSESGIDCGAKCQATVERGEEVNLKAYGDSTTTFVGWDGTCAGSAPSCTVAMDQARDVEARFSEGVPLMVQIRGSGLGAVTSDPVWTPCFALCAGTFQRDTTIELVAKNRPGYAFDHWSGDCSGSKPTCRLTMDRESQVGSHFEPGYELTVSKSGNGEGSVTSAPQRIDCGPSCAESFVTGTVVTLTAQPDSRSAFVGWSGACSGTGPECTVIVDQSREVEAEFVRWSQLDVERTGSGQGTVRSDIGGIECGASCGHLFPPGTEVELTADPAPGHAFIGWGGACEGSSPTCSVNLPGDLEVSARFEPIFGLVVTKAGTGQGRVASMSGSIDCGVTCATEVNGVTEVTLRAQPEPGSAFVEWSGACSGTGFTCTVTVDEEKAVTATFSPGHDVSVSKAGADTGVVTSVPARIECGSACEAGFAENAIVTLRATPDQDHAFVEWSGACAGAGLTCTLTVSQDSNVTATFAPGHMLEVGSHGPVPGRVVSDPVRIDCGDTCAQAFVQDTEVTLTAIPSPGNAFVEWDGACAGARLSCTVTMGQAREVTANFTWGRRMVVEKAGSGSGIVTSNPQRLDCGAVCQEFFPHDARVTLTAVPAAGSRFDGWTGICKGASTTCVVRMGSDRNTSVVFTKQWPLSVSVSGSGLGKVVSAPVGLDCGFDCESLYPDGTVVTLSAQSTGGSRFTGWTGDCQGTATTCQVTLSEARNVEATFTWIPRLRVTKLGSGHITSEPAGISCGTVCDGEFPQGTPVVLTATPENGSYFVEWSGACEGSEPVCSLSTGTDRHVVARFERLVPVVVATEGEGKGRVTSQPTGIDCGDRCVEMFPPDTNVTLTATAASGSIFAGWTGACEGQGPTCVITAGTSAEARFLRASRLSVNVTGKGMVHSRPSGISCADSCAGDFATGTEVTLRATSGDGWQLASWSGSCKGSGAECVVTLADSRSVTATFNVGQGVCAPTRAKVGPTLLDRKQKFLAIRVRTGQPGRIVTAASPTLGKTVARVGPTGTVRFKLRIKSGARAKLRKHGRTKVNTSLTFRPDTGCAAAVRRISFKLRRRATLDRPR